MRQRGDDTGRLLLCSFGCAIFNSAAFAGIIVRFVATLVRTEQHSQWTLIGNVTTVEDPTTTVNDPKSGSVGQATTVNDPKSGLVGSATTVNNPELGLVGKAATVNDPIFGSVGHVMAVNDPNFQLKWLHIPKCGSSFGNVLITYGCKRLSPNAITEPHLWWHKKRRGKSNSKKCMHINVTCIHAPVGEKETDCKPPGVGGYAALFRDPEQRILSEWYYVKSLPEIHKGLAELPVFVANLAGCQTKMLTGVACDQDQVKPSQATVDRAIKNMHMYFAFVGLTEEWKMSVCLFHKMFGKRCNQREFLNRRPGPQGRDDGYDTSVLNGFTDEYDRQVYAAAKQMFQQNLVKYGVNKESCEAECWNE